MLHSQEDVLLLVVTRLPLPDEGVGRRASKTIPAYMMHTMLNNEYISKII